MITVHVTDPKGIQRRVPMLFDTGSEVTLLDAKLAHYVGAATWTQGYPVPIAGVGAQTPAYLFSAGLSLFGKTLGSCPIRLMDLSHLDFIQGILGRDVFHHFGFGFWERDRVLFYTSNP